MRPEIEQELAHTLLVELLAYQFASPVRWIETQDVILAEKRTERIVEIGPADTLGGMAKRTLASKYEAYDAATSVQRQILCYNKDAKEIYYDVDPVEDEPETPEPSADSGSAAPAGAAAPAAAPVAAAPSAGPAAMVEDAPVSATDIVRTLVAQKLKKGLTDIPVNKAIKDLVGGKSIVSREIATSDHKLTFHSQENPLCRMKSSVIWAKSSVQLQRNPKIPRSTNWVRPCRLHSTDSSVNSLRPWSLVWCLRRCLVGSILQQ
jgi:hypothetical protein